MSQRRITLNLLVSVFFLTLCLSITSCATLAVNQFVHHPKSEFVDEFKPANMQLAGVYSGLENIYGKSHARIVVLPDSEDCKERPIIELLLPMEKDSDAKVTFRMSDSLNEQLLVKDRYSGQPVKIIFYSATNDKELNINEGMKLMLSNYNWSGYPSTVIVGFKRNIYADTFAYKIASGDEDIAMHHFNAEGKYHNKWACKNKENNVAGTMLKPFTVIFDIITFPVQALFMVFTISIFGT